MIGTVADMAPLPSKGADGRTDGRTQPDGAFSETIDSVGSRQERPSQGRNAPIGSRAEDGPADSGSGRKAGRGDAATNGDRFALALDADMLAGEGDSHAPAADAIDRIGDPGTSGTKRQDMDRLGLLDALKARLSSSALSNGEGGRALPDGAAGFAGSDAESDLVLDPTVHEAGRPDAEPTAADADGKAALVDRAAAAMALVSAGAAHAPSPPAASAQLAAALRSALPADRGAGQGIANGSAARPGDEADRLFSFARAGGETASLPGDQASRTDRLSSSVRGAMESLGALADRRQRDLADARTADRRMPADFSVVESRKFLGVAVNHTSAAAVVSAITENPTFNAMLRGAAATAATTLDAARNASNSLKVQLSPAELGMVTATFRLSGGNLSIELRVETIEAYRQLSDDQSSILKALKGHGYDVEQVTIQHVGSERGQGTGSSDAGGENRNGQPAADGRSTGSGEGRGDERGARKPDHQPQSGTGDGEGDNGRPHQPGSRDVYL